MRELQFLNAEERKKKKAADQDAAVQELARKKAPLLSEIARLEELLTDADDEPMFCTLVQASIDQTKDKLKLIKVTPEGVRVN